MDCAIIFLFLKFILFVERRILIKKNIHTHIYTYTYIYINSIDLNCVSMFYYAHCFVEFHYLYYCTEARTFVIYRSYILGILLILEFLLFISFAEWCVVYLFGTHIYINVYYVGIIDVIPFCFFFITFNTIYKYRW